MSHDCSFCEIVKDPSQAHIILSTPTLLVFLDRLPLSRGHILCIPRLHYPHLPTFPSHISAKLGEILPSLSKALTKVIGVDDFNVILNNGERAGQTVQHVHWHIIPRPGDGTWGMFARGPRTNELDDDEAALLAFELREELGRGLWTGRTPVEIRGQGRAVDAAGTGGAVEHVRGPLAQLVGDESKLPMGTMQLKL